MRTLILALGLAVAAAPLAAQAHGDPDHAAHGGALPAGWHAKLDRANANLSDVSFTNMGDGVHVTSGPAAIYWRPENTFASGDYRVQATFAQTRAPTHPEAYGIVIAGKNLDTDPDYMYFLVRGDGKYMVKHRAAGGEIHTIVDWTDSPAVVKQDAAGKATNTLTAEAGAWGVRFLANGTKVAEFLTANVPYLNTQGIAGLRVNHNLDVHVSGFSAAATR
ncbi:MAG TPA: hypothetical protein VFQ39_15580 [Longimicrobium sp.]|nr:hypothetical protein [Longimicrobium sp.]